MNPVVLRKEIDMICSRFCQTMAGLGMIAAIFGSGVVSPAADPPAKPKKTIDNGPRPEEAAVLSEKTVVHADLAYGKDAKQRLDVYAPRGSGRAGRRLLPPRRMDQGGQERSQLQAQVPQRKRDRTASAPITACRRM